MEKEPQKSDFDQEAYNDALEKKNMIQYDYMKYMQEKEKGEGITEDEWMTIYAPSFAKWFEEVYLKDPDLNQRDLENGEDLMILLNSASEYIAKHGKNIH